MNKDLIEDFPMKEMSYDLQTTFKDVLYSGIYRGYKFVIVSHGSHPSAYVENKLFLSLNDANLRVNEAMVPHISFTSCGTPHWTDADKTEYLGWHYCSVYDFDGRIDIGEGSKGIHKWTTEQIFRQIKELVDYLCDEFELENKPFHEYFPMKEMVYSPERKDFGILYAGFYKGYKFLIIGGTHPCAYVENKNGLKNYDDANRRFRNKCFPHGGFTYYDTEFWNCLMESAIVDKRVYLGWDYAHSNDYVAYSKKYDKLQEGYKRWTTQEVFDEVKSVIDYLSEVGYFVEGEYYG